MGVITDKGINMEVIQLPNNQPPDLSRYAMYQPATAEQAAAAYLRRYGVQPVTVYVAAKNKRVYIEVKNGKEL